MRIGNLILENPVCLAPMAGVTDRPFRQLCRRFGAGLVYSEFLSADGLVRNSMRQQSKIEFTSTERPIGFQLFGAQGEVLAAAAKELCRAKPDLIDLNFGCPVKKVIRKNGGVAMLKNLTLLEDSVRRVAEAIDLPLTVKIRAGFTDESPVFVEAAQRAVNAGAQVVTLHARSGKAGYNQPANWELIRELKEAVDVPVIGNGDVRSPADAQAMLKQTGCDAVMIGRAALGRPWIFRGITEFLRTGRIPPEPSLAEKFDIILWHLAESQKLHGSRRGLFRMRRQMGWYVRGLPGATALRQQLFTTNNYEEVSQTLSDYRRQNPTGVADPESGTEPLSDTQGPW